MKSVCPKCYKEIDIKKYRLFTCTCGAKLLAIKINKETIVQDVTPEEELKNEGN